MSGVLAGRVGKKRSSRPRRQVLRMMAIMQDGNNGEVPKEFLEGGRTGRRNAMPDILSPPDAHASTADLPAKLQELATSVDSTTVVAGNVDDDQLLMKFLDSGCAGRRNAMPQVTPPNKSNNGAAENACNSQEAPGTDPNVCEIINLDIEQLEEMLGNSSICDPKNPQPGPSNQPGPPSDKDDAQKASGS